MSLQDFERLGTEYVAQIKNGKLHALSNVTLDQFFYEVVIKLAQRNNKASWKDDLSRYERYIKPELGQMKLSEIRTYHIQLMLNGLPERLAPASSNHVRSVMHNALNTAVRFELLERNPCSAIRTLPTNNAVERILEPGEAAAFIHVCLESPTSLPNLALILALLTGVRIGNVISITRAMLSADLTSILLPHTKSGKKQLIPLPKEAQWVVSQALSLGASEYLFPSDRSQSGHITHPAAAFKIVCEKAGIATTGSTYPIASGFPKEPLTIHCLRKSFGSAVQQHTGDIHCTSSMLGHADISITAKRYTFLQKGQCAEAAQGASHLLTRGSGIPNYPRIDLGASGSAVK